MRFIKKVKGKVIICCCLVIGAALVSCGKGTETMADYAQRQPKLGFRSAVILELDGLRFKDLNGNGQLDPYEDWRLSNEERSKDLLAKMSLEQKAGVHADQFNSPTK